MGDLELMEFLVSDLDPQTFFLSEHSEHFGCDALLLAMQSHQEGIASYLLSVGADLMREVIISIAMCG